MSRSPDETTSSEHQKRSIDLIPRVSSSPSVASSGVLASTSSHPHHIAKTRTESQQEANAAPGHPHPLIESTPVGPHLADARSRPTPSSPLDSRLSPSSTFDPRLLHSIPETGFAAAAAAAAAAGDQLRTPSSSLRAAPELGVKSRKRSSSSPIDPAEPTRGADASAEKQADSSRNQHQQHQQHQQQQQQPDSGRNKRGRKPIKLDMKSKLEKSRQSARECRARKKLRYQYLEELVSAREKAIFRLREELEMYKNWCKDMDEGKIPPDMKSQMEKLEKKLVMPGDERQAAETGEDEAEDDTDDDDSDDSDDFEEEEDEEEAAGDKQQPRGSN